MDKKYEDMYKALKDEADTTMKERSIDKCIEEFKEVVNSRVDEIHKLVDVARDDLITNGVEAFDKDQKSKNETTEKALDGKETNFKAKVADLISSLDSMLKRTEYLDNSIKELKEIPLAKLLKIKKNEIFFPQTNRFKLKAGGKADCDLGWKKDQNKPENSNIDPNDESVLKVHANACYNYYQTDREFTDEDVIVTFETTCKNTDEYFYFGIINESLVPNSSCMCCSPQNNWYLKHNGYLVSNGSNRNESNLEFKSKNGEPTVITIRLLTSEKQAYFQVDDKDEVGPVTLTGSRFRFTSGSCNTCNGDIKITGCTLV